MSAHAFRISGGIGWRMVFTHFSFSKLESGIENGNKIMQSFNLNKLHSFYCNFHSSSFPFHLTYEKILLCFSIPVSILVFSILLTYHIGRYSNPLSNTYPFLYFHFNWHNLTFPSPFSIIFNST